MGYASARHAIGVPILCSFLAFTAAYGASIEGVVLDPTGAVVPNVSIQLTCKDNGLDRKVVSGRDGRYRFAEVPGGTCEIKAEMPGFRKLFVAVTLSSEQKLKQDLTLQVGDVVESVTVEAASPSISTQSASVSGGGRRGAPSRPERIPATGIRLPSGRFHTDQFDHFVENEFLSPGRHPLATFGADVDTASYSIVRRHIRDGELPPPGAIRVEEMVNYFRYEDPEPSGQEPFGIRTQLADCPWKRGNLLVRVSIRTRSMDVADLPPANLVFLIDVSGSMMEENKLPLVKQSLRLLVEQLRAQDKVSIVVYAGASGVVLPATPGSEKQRILASIDELRAGGSTHGSEGIRLAYEMATRSFLEKGNNRVILVTDGDFNVGVTSESELVRLIEKHRESGVALSVLGYGFGNLKDSLMEKLADHGNGNYGYIDTLDEARRVFVGQLGGTLYTVAKDVKFQVEFNPKRVAQYRLIGYENRVLRPEEFNDDRKDAGDLGAGHQTTAFFEITPRGLGRTVDENELRYQETRNTERARSNEWAFVKIRYKPPQEKKSRLLQFPVVQSAVRLAETGPEFRFGAAVVEAAQILRESKFAGEGSMEAAIRRAREAIAADEDGRRAEFVAMLESASRLLRERKLRSELSVPEGVVR